MDDDAIVGVWCDEGPLEGNRRLDDDEEAWDVCDDNDDAAACSDGKDDDDEYGNDVLVQPVVVAVLPIGSTGATKGSQDGNDGDDGARGGTTAAAAVCGAVDVEEEALDIATLDAVAVERGKDGDDDGGGGAGCWYFNDALGSLAGSDGNGPLPVSWEYSTVCRDSLAGASEEAPAPAGTTTTVETQGCPAELQTEPLLATTCFVINCESLSRIIVEYW